MKLNVKLNDTYRVQDIERDKVKPDWVESETVKGTTPDKNVLPILPSFLLPLVNGYTQGEPISKDIVVIPISGQQWQAMMADERNKLLELVEFTGKDAGDYCREFQSHFPRDPDFSKRK